MNKQKNHSYSRTSTTSFPINAPSNSKRMAGGNHLKSSSNKGPSASASTASSHRKSRWESPKHPPSDRKSNPSPKPPTPAQSKPLPDPAHAPFTPPGPPFPFSDPQPPPAYGFHMLDRRTIILADGSVRSYFALPPDYDFAPRHGDPSHRFLRSDFGNRFPPQLSPEAGGFRGNREFWNKPIGGPDGVGPMKRKYGDDMQYANPSGEGLAGMSGPFEEELRPSKFMRNGVGGGQSVVKHNYFEVDESGLKKAFLHFMKAINENVAQRKSYLENGKQGRVQCIACRRFD